MMTTQSAVLERLTHDQREEFATAIHEAGHACAAVLAGGSVESARLLFDADNAGQTVFRGVPVHDRPEVFYAGAWAEAKWRAFGTTPTLPQIREVLSASGHKDDAELLRQNAGQLPRAVERNLTNCWAAIVTLGAQIYAETSVDDAEVRAALGLSSDPEIAAAELHLLRGGAVPGSFSITLGGC